MLDEALLQKVIAYALQVINEVRRVRTKYIEYRLVDKLCVYLFLLQSRKEKDLLPLELDSSLTRFSQEHASDMLQNNYIRWGIICDICISTHNLVLNRNAGWTHAVTTTSGATSPTIAFFVLGAVSTSWKTSTDKMER